MLLAGALSASTSCNLFLQRHSEIQRKVYKKGTLTNRKPVTDPLQCKLVRNSSDSLAFFCLRLKRSTYANTLSIWNPQIFSKWKQRDVPEPITTHSAP
jgi:hypothetical protein